MTRRGFLGGVLGAWAFLDSSLAGVEQLVKGEIDAEDEAFWADLRKQFRPTDEVIAFNNAGLSPSPQMVLDSMRLEIERANGDPSLVVYRRQALEVEKVRKRLAGMLGVPTEHLALTPNATYGLHTGMMGVDRREEREILFSAHEYPRAIACAKQRTEREQIVSRSLEVKWQRPSVETEQSILREIGDKPLVVVASTVTYLNGTVLPVESICTAVRERGGLSLIDGAQSIGILPTNLVKMGCDMYTACLHKWVMAPVGTGVFYVKPELISKLWALNPAEASDSERIQKFEHWGTRPFAQLLAVDAALDFGEMIPADSRLARVNVLRNRLISGLSGVKGVEILSSRERGQSELILSVGVKGRPGSMLAGDLWSRFGIHCTVAIRAGLDGVRLSPSIFTSIKECDLVVSAIRQLAEKS